MRSDFRYVTSFKQKWRSLLLLLECFVLFVFVVVCVAFRQHEAASGSALIPAGSDGTEALFSRREILSFCVCGSVSLRPNDSCQHLKFIKGMRGKHARS